MVKALRLMSVWFVIGAFYFVLEGIWRIPQGGYANIVMLPIGGLCGLLVGGINQIPRFYNMKILWQTLIGTVMVLVVEFVAGYVLNIGLGLDLWHYEHFSIMGQVSLAYGLFWFLITPFGIWFEDAIRYELWQEGTPYSVVSVYKELVTCQ